ADHVPANWPPRAHYLLQFERAIDELEENILEAYRHIDFLASEDIIQSKGETQKKRGAVPNSTLAIRGK
ncbi:unnamed protein product, partial [marine sediment metagenome]